MRDTPPTELPARELDFSVQDGVGYITLNRPYRRNAFTMEMVDLWVDALREATDDPAIRVVVLRGAGDAFCSGLDLDTIDDCGTEPLDRKCMLHERVQRIPRLVQELDKPLIASVHGPAFGAGMDMSLMCDLRLADSTAQFCESYIRVGLVPGAGGLYFLSRLVGVAKALELFLTGDVIDAEEAHRIGIVNRLVADGELEAATDQLARKLAAGPAVATRLIKRALYQSAETDLRTALDLVSSHMAVIQSTAESREAIAAFREHRRPHFDDAG
jgi:enoyl-CoA hydratase/carnithine racemase